MGNLLQCIACAPTTGERCTKNVHIREQYLMVCAGHGKADFVRNQFDGTTQAQRREWAERDDWNHISEIGRVL